MPNTKAIGIKTIPKVKIPSTAKTLESDAGIIPVFGDNLAIINSP